MPQNERSLVVPGVLGEVFAFFLSPANLATLAPPEMRLQLIEGPDRLELGARVAWKGRRWSVPYTVVTEVTAFEPNALLGERQVQGPLRHWELTRCFEAVAEGTRLSERVEFEPPGGLLGLTVTARAVEEELAAAFAYSAARLDERFGPANEARI